MRILRAPYLQDDCTQIGSPRCLYGYLYVFHEAWAAGEAAIMRTMVVHGLLLTRRAQGSKPLGKCKVHTYMSHELKQFD